MMQPPLTVSNEIYDAYVSAFRKLQSAAHDPRVSILSVAKEVELLLVDCPEDVRYAVSFALGDALSCLPPMSRTHLSRILEERRDGTNPTNAH